MTQKVGRPRIGTDRVVVVLPPRQARFLDRIRIGKQSRADVIRSIIETQRAALLEAVMVGGEREHEKESL